MQTDSKDNEARSLGQRYAIRTILISLQAIYRGGDSRAFPTAKNRNEWLESLGGYLDKYPNDKLDAILKMIKKYPIRLEREYDEHSHFPDVDI